MINLKNNFFLIAFCLLSVADSKAQGTVIDRVVAVVGVNIILQSDIEAQYQQMLSSQEPVNEKTHCKILEDLLYQKLLLAQAQKDSLTVSDAQVEQELDKRMNYYIQQFGSEERFVAFYGKSVENFKMDLKDNIRDILLGQQMQGKIINDVTASPNDVRTYYNSLPEDSIPYINSEIEIGQLVKKPKATAEAKREAKEKIEGIRQRIISGQSSFTSMAALYSEDPGSANKGGFYEHIQRGQFVPEWEAWAFKLNPNDISEVFETVYGYFVIQLVARRGNEVDVRSLLISPKIDTRGLIRAKEQLDSLYTALEADSIKFADATAKYSDEDETKNSGGLMTNPFTGTTRFQMDQLGQVDQNVAFAIDKLKVGGFTKPMPMTSHDGKQAYRILYLKLRTSPHRANLKDDYPKLQAIATAKKRQAAIQTWITKKVAETFVRIADDYKNCTFNHKWIN